MSQVKKKVCIVGAGAAGLAGIRHINESKNLTGIVLESSGAIGGIWNYSEKIVKYDRKEEITVHSTAYRGLRTNLPKQIMGYLDYSFDQTGNSFITHTEVLEFLNQYVKRYQLLDSIRFHARVVSIKPILKIGVEKKAEIAKINAQDYFDYVHWKVVYMDLKKNVTETEHFDALLICNGHFCKPLIPLNTDLDEFSGMVIHSRDYRIPETFTNKRVLVLGCGPSGIDILLEIYKLAADITLSMRQPPYVGKLPEKIRQAGDIIDIKKSKVTFSDGSIQEFDVILLCTGYEYHLPFLKTECGLSIDRGKFIGPLFRHMVNINYPTMALIGLPFRICPFMLFDAQVRNFVKFLEGEVQFPSKELMMQELLEESKYREMKGIPFSRSHQLEELQWTYFKTLGKEADFDNLLQQLSIVRKIYEKVAERRRHFPMLYKMDKLHVYDTENFTFIEAIEKLE